MTFSIQPVGRYEVPARLFHITRLDNVDRIRIEGLIPGKSKTGLLIGGGHVERQRREFVWLTDNTDYILLHQAGEHWIKRSSAVSLCISTEGLQLHRVSHSGMITTTLYPHEWVTRGIPPQNIVSVSSVIDHMRYRETAHHTPYMPLDRPYMNSAIYDD